MEHPLTGLLCELVWFFAAKLKTPRWLCTVDEACLMTILFRRKTVIPDFHLLVLMEIRHLLPSFTRTKTAKNNYSENNFFIFTKPELQRLAIYSIPSGPEINRIGPVRTMRFTGGQSWISKVREVPFMFLCFHNSTKSQCFQKISTLIGSDPESINHSDFFNY